MFERLTLTNYRKFPKFTLSLHRRNVLVGPNNTGKSSLLDAFRLLDACYRVTRNKSPNLLRIEGEGFVCGYEVSESVLPFRLANVTYNYSDDDALVEFKLSNGTRAIIRLHPDRPTRFYVAGSGASLSSSARFRRAIPIDLIIVPTLAPLEAEEALVEDETVRRNATTRLASRVLRNIWLRRDDDDFDDFRREIESAWPNITIRKPERVRMTPPIVQMFYSESRIQREVQWAGFGFQVWLQVQTHLRRGGEKSVLIIDEPDIYLHPDLQRRLLRDIESKFEQFILATHSVEIVNEARANDIVSINSDFRTGRRVKSDDDYAALFNYLGSADNADIARITRARRVIFVEGHDRRLIRRIAERLGLVRLCDAQTTPIVQLGGFSEWRRAANAVWAFREVLELEIKTFCLFDRDFRCQEEVDEFRNSADIDFERHVFERKEIENYLLEPEAIRRAVLQQLKSRKSPLPDPSNEQIEAWLFEATEKVKYHVLSQRTASRIRYAESHGTKLDTSTLIHLSAAQFDEGWNTLPFRLSCAPGKDILARLNDILQKELKISLTHTKLIEQLSASSIDPEMLQVFKRLEEFCSK